MWAPRFWARRFWAGRFWPPVVSDGAIFPPGVWPTGVSVAPIRHRLSAASFGFAVSAEPIRRRVEIEE